MKKKIIALLLAVVMMAAMIPAVSAADSDFVVVDGELVEYNGSGGKVVIPDGVTKIGDGVFSEAVTVTDVIIPDSVTYIDSQAFTACYNLKTVSIPDSVTFIGMSAFALCDSLTSVVIPGSVKTIDKSAFSNCTNLADIVISDGVVTIGDYAFPYSEKLTTVTIPSSVKTIGSGAFGGSPKLKTVNIANGTESIGGYAFENCSALTDVTIPSSVKSIDENAFDGCTNLTEVDFGGAQSQWNKITCKYRDYEAEKETQMDFSNGGQKKAGLDGIAVHFDSSATDPGPEQSRFSDVPTGAWYAADVEYVTSHDLFNGTSNTTFAPQNPMTRAMFVTVLSRIVGIDGKDIVDNETFTDSSFSSWYGPAVQWASENGIVNGVGANTFLPDQNLTREQMAVMVYRFLSKLSVKQADDPTSPKSFTDADMVSGYAKDAVEEMRRVGLLKGSSGKVEPQRNITRAEAAAFLTRLDKLLNTYDEVVGIFLSNTALTLEPEDTVRLVAYTLPVKAAAKVTLTSSDSGIVTADNLGVVTGVSAGSTTIYATSENGLSAGCTVTVEADEVQAAPTLNVNEDVIIQTGDTFQLEVLNAEGAELTWTANNPSVLTVSDSGLVTALSNGTCKVTVSGDQIPTQECVFIVSDDPVPCVSGFQSKDDLTVYAKVTNGTTTEYRYYSDNGDGSEWSWSRFTPSIWFFLDAGHHKNTTASYYFSFSSSNPKVASIDEKGKITAHASGTAVITVAPQPYVTGRSYTFNVVVEDHTTSGGIQFTVRNDLRIDKNHEFTATVTSSEGKDDELRYIAFTYESSDPSVATVTGTRTTAHISTHKPGFVTITAKTDVGTSASFTFEVFDYQASVQEQVDGLMALIDEGMTEYEKMCVMCHYILDNYRYELYGNYTAPGMFTYGSGDCLGYADLVSSYCKALGLECVIRQESNAITDTHFANRIKADGVWYYVDCSMNNGTRISMYVAHDMP